MHGVHSLHVSKLIDRTVLTVYPVSSDSSIGCERGAQTTRSIQGRKQREGGIDRRRSSYVRDQSPFLLFLLHAHAAHSSIDQHNRHLRLLFQRGAMRQGFTGLPSVLLLFLPQRILLISLEQGRSRGSERRARVRWLMQAAAFLQARPSSEIHPQIQVR